MYPKILEALLVIGLVCGAWFYAGHRAVAEYKQEVALEQAAATAAQQAKYETLAQNYEALKTERAKNARVIVKEVEKIVAGDTVYRNVCVSPDGLQIINSSLSGQGASIPDAKVPSTESP